MLASAHRHLRHAGIALGICQVTPGPPAKAPTLAQLMAESDLFGSLTPNARAVIAEHLAAIARERGETLIQEGAMPDALFLLAGGTVEVSRGHGDAKRVLLRAGPGDSVGMIGLIMGTAALMTATSLTPVIGYSLHKSGFAAALRACPELAAGLEAQARRGQAWLRCEGEAHEIEQVKRPDLLLVRLRMFLKRLDT